MVFFMNSDEEVCLKTTKSVYFVFAPKFFDMMVHVASEFRWLLMYQYIISFYKQETPSFKRIFIVDKGSVTPLF
jgi:hypothetical protein